MDRRGYIDQATLDELVRCIVDCVQPRRIILFGSAARGQMGPNSDLDILVVMPDGVHRRKTAQRLYRELPGHLPAMDLIVVTESDVADYSGNPSLVVYPAVREGTEIYSATA